MPASRLSPPDVAIILVNWNGGADTTECLESLLRSQDQSFRVIIVDNGSTDDSLQRLEDWAAAPEPAKLKGAPWRFLPDKRTRQPRLERLRPHDVPPSSAQIVVLEAGENLGFAGGNNLGMAVALSDPDIRYLWLLNNDTAVAADALTHLRARMHAEPACAMIGARLMYYDTPDRVQGVGGRFSPALARGWHLGHNATTSTLPSAQAIEAQMTYVMGASIFAPVATVMTIGPMSEQYFLYFEEQDWAQRLGPSMRLGVALDAVIYHKEGASIGTSSRHRPSDTSLYYLTAGLLRFIAKHYPACLPLALGRIVRESLHYLRPFDADALRVTTRAVLDCATGRKHTGPITARPAPPR